MHAANRVLILPLEDLTESERADIHMANEYHWRAEPGKVADRPLMDCSNAQTGITPLNTEVTKQLARHSKIPTSGPADSTRSRHGVGGLQTHQRNRVERHVDVQSGHL